jgi:hypothetical protein
MNETIHNPITPKEIEWRVQSAKDGKMIIVPYITNRCVQQRFDAAFGCESWTSEFREIQNGFICRLTVLYKGNTIYREDGASKTTIEPEKGGISDAMKRAAVQFGLGRSLYDYPRVMIKTDGKYIPFWAYPKLDKLVTWLNEGNSRDVVIIEETK